MDSYVHNLRKHLGFQRHEARGRGVTVAVIDTGVDLTHPDFDGAISHRSKSFVGPMDDIMDGAGHGTQMAGIIGGRSGFHDDDFGGVAPEATLLVLRVGQSAERLGLGSIVEAIDYAIEQKADIINLSISTLAEEVGVLRRYRWIDRLFRGGAPPEWIQRFAAGRFLFGGAPPPPRVWRRLPDLSDALDRAEYQGVLCVTAAGNESHYWPRPGTISPPGGHGTVVTVGSINPGGFVSGFSGRPPYFEGNGPLLGVRTRRGKIDGGKETPGKPDLVALGEAVWAADTSLPDLQRPEESQMVKVGSDERSRTYALSYGTSCSTAVVSGIAACALEHARNIGAVLAPNPATRLRHALQQGAHRKTFAPTADAGRGEASWTGTWREIENLPR